MADWLTECGPGWRPEHGPSYPHMMPEDKLVWDRFLDQRKLVIQRCWYDVHVGQYVQVPKDLPVEMLRVSQAVTRKRIDVVALMGGVYHVIEVKPWGGYVALGQALVYWRLLKVEFPTLGPSLPMVVCGSVDPDCIDDFQEHAVGVYQVGLE